MHITLTDTDLATPSIVPLQIFLQESTETILLVAATSTDQRAGQFTGELLVYSEILPASLPKSGARVKWGEELQMRYHDFLPDEIVTVQVRMPAPQFVEPTPTEGQVLSTAENCPLLQLIKVDDPNGYQVEMWPTRYWSDHDWHSVRAHNPQDRLQPCALTQTGAWECKKGGTHDYPAGDGFMPGASLENLTSTLEEELQAGGRCPYDRSLSRPCGSVLHGVQTGVFSWTATTQDKGRVWTQCFRSRQVNGAVVGPERCFRIHSERCHRCAVKGESLYSIASGLGTEWDLLFSINPDLRHFSDLPSGLRLKTGLRYRAVKGDSIESLGVRFGIMLEHIFRANPEARARTLVPGDDVCLAPLLVTADGCSPQPKSSTWEPIEEQYVPPDYWDNPFNWESIEYDTDPRGLPTKVPNPLYPQRPAVS
jgi:hypothetical protein